MIDYDAVWQQLENNAGRTFTTSRGLEFTYSVIGHEMKISRKAVPNPVAIAVCRHQGS